MSILKGKNSVLGPATSKSYLGAAAALVQRRKTWGRRRASGLPGGVVAPGSVSSAPLIWFDFNDLTTMYVDDGVTNVSADAEDIVYMVNKGTATAILDDESVSNPPSYDTSTKPAGGTVSGVGFFSRGATEALGGAVEYTSTPFGSGECSFACVMAHESNVQPEIIFAWDGTEIMVQNDTTDERLTAWCAAEQQDLDAGVGTSDITDLDTWVAVWCTTDATAESQFVVKGSYANTGAGGGHVFAQDPTTGSELFIGRWLGGQYWDGWIGEVLVWDTTLTTAETEALESYFSTKYGVTFAA